MQSKHCANVIPKELVDPESKDGNPRCVACKATCLAPIVGVGWICNQCVKQYGPRRPIYPGPSRREILESADRFQRLEREPIKARLESGKTPLRILLELLGYR